MKTRSQSGRPGRGAKASTAPPTASLWYRDAIIYELHVRSFSDSDGNGIGDFRGLTEKLGYLQDLGVTALWLLPFYPSPLKDDGYDIADYVGVHPSYGTLRDFEAFLREAHRRGLRVVTELVLNHTSDQHPWFQRARRARPGDRWRAFYVWSDTPQRYADARIIFKDFEASNWAWDPVAGAYYWHRFYSHQPDLNYDHPDVRAAMLRVVDFWFEMGVDGLRLDAVPYLYEREGTNCENLPETHAFLQELRRHVDAHFPDRMLLAEANQWPEDAVAYFGAGNECHMAFHFPLMPRLFMAIRMEDRFPVIDMLEQTPAIPEGCQWALFLRNHDELTLEMVTDEERDYMHRVYAADQQARINLGIRRRLAPLLGNSSRRIELMFGLLMSLPGTPVLYYGDEIGMGDNVYLGDRNGVRTPMQWSPDRNAGFSRANPQQLYLPVIVGPEYHYEAVNVEAQQHNPSSRLWWTRRLIGLRRQFAAFSRGTLQFLSPDNKKILAYLLRAGDECLLVVANLSRFVEYVELALGDFRGWVPVELFGRHAFPRIGDLPYLLTLGPHAFYWFLLQPDHAGPSAAESAADLPIVHSGRDWTMLLAHSGRTPAEPALRRFLSRSPWFEHGANQVKTLSVTDTVPLSAEGETGTLALLRAEYVEGEAENYLLPLAVASSRAADRLLREFPQAAVARLKTPGDGTAVLHDATSDAAFWQTLLDAMIRRRRLRGAHGQVTAGHTRALGRSTTAPAANPLMPPIERHNTSVVFGHRFVLKVFRRLEPGPHPEVEIDRLLTAQGFPHAPALAATLEYRDGGDPTVLGVLHEFVPHEEDAWQQAQRVLSGYLEHALARRGEVNPVPLPGRSVAELAAGDPPLLARELMGPYLESAAALGRRTAALHLALGSERSDPAFVPEPFSVLYQRSIYQSVRTLTRGVFHRLRRRLSSLPDAVHTEAAAVVGLEAEVLRRFKVVLERRIGGTRIRCHGSYQLGQVLHTGRDFVIIDFEGDPRRTLGERRIKRSPLSDVASMLRSFSYAAGAAVLTLEDAGTHRPGDLAYLRDWAAFWAAWAGAAFVRAYLDTLPPGRLLPRREDELSALLEAHLLERVVQELGAELDDRPIWLAMPFRGLRDALTREPPSLPR